MSKHERLEITDAQRIRAMAHPLRIELLDILGTVSEATATECAERTGESVASCSFHLRMLAKYAYVEPAEPRGREKPWRLVSRSRSVSADWTDPASVAAAEEFAVLAVDREAERLRSWIHRVDEEPREWSEHTVITKSAVWLTREELAEVSETLASITDRFRDRDDPSARPPGARLVRLFGATTVDPDRPSDPDNP